MLRVLRALGPVDADSFDERLRLQKLAYLVQEIGGGPFVYYWGMRGPSSPAFAELIAGEEEGDGKQGGGAVEAEPSEDEEELARRVRTLVGGRVDDPLEAELYASVWYLTPTRRLSDWERESIRESMRRAKPHFAKERVGQVLGEIEAFRAANGLGPQDRTR